ncbi:DUF3347 domain-containing protein [Antarcticibacterium sp. 1MA-6-2]|uniref:DUF3347 domain-containing protein n=1 Tax=Antarcticibacterium sp. 1MA-6-2 TaxID=2908210 RepID=UPI001F2963FF|nr:DUF3347 domain-containing protein [Antarcticibacterium sp. 1MA-6-2]UJH89817.1 DUF3347 domain-containing protein [Antarcticibacterium sp. 1MA-6-2]
MVKSGLENGEEIVTNGTFTVDAAVQLSGRPSMMNPSADVKKGNLALEVEISEAAKAELNLITAHYLELKDALVSDQFSEAKSAALNLQKEIENVSAKDLNEAAAVVWKSYKEQLMLSLKNMAAAAGIEEMRNSFDELSNTLIGMVTSFKLSSGELYVLHCPMSNSNRGADWLSASPEIRNPYYGAAMLKCGEVKREIN